MHKSWRPSGRQGLTRLDSLLEDFAIFIEQDCVINVVARNSMLGFCCSRATRPTTNLYILKELGNNFVHHMKRRTVFAHHRRCLAMQASFSRNSTTLANVQSDFISTQSFRVG